MTFGRGGSEPPNPRRACGAEHLSARPRPSTPLNDPRAVGSRGSLSGAVSSVGAEGQTNGAAHYNRLYVEAFGSWRDAWREVYG